MNVNKTLHLDYTSKCNLRCKHCYNSKYFSIHQTIDFVKCTQFILNEGINHVHFLGGEPLLDNSLFKLIDILPSNVSFSINTNGTTLDSIMCEQILKNKNIREITISLDGFDKESNDTIRGNGTYELVLNHIKDMILHKKEYSSDIIISIACCVTPDNIHSFKNFKLNSIFRYIDNLLISTMYMQGNANENYEIEEAFYESYVDAIINFIEINNEADFKIILDSTPLILEMLNLKNANKCSCLNNSIKYMNVLGEVYGCGPEYTMKINKIGENIDNSNDICSECPYLNECSACKLGLYFSRKNYCKAAANILKKIYYKNVKGKFKLNSSIIMIKNNSHLSFIDFNNFRRFSTDEITFNKVFDYDHKLKIYILNYQTNLNCQLIFYKLLSQRYIIRSIDEFYDKRNF